MNERITIQPTIRTSGGEICDIMIADQYAGTITLLYRELDCVYGSVQLDRETLPLEQKGQVSAAVRSYIQALIDAVGAQDCEVLVTFSDLDHLIAIPETEAEPGEWEYDVVDTDSELGDIGSSDRDEYTMNERNELELIIQNETYDHVEYQLINEAQQLMAEATASVKEPDVEVEIRWRMFPSEELINNAIDLIVSDFDDGVIETFILEMKYKGRTIETVELAHKRIIHNNWMEDEANRHEREYH